MKLNEFWVVLLRSANKKNAGVSGQQHLLNPFSHWMKRITRFEKVISCIGILPALVEERKDSNFLSAFRNILSPRWGHSFGLNGWSHQEEKAKDRVWRRGISRIWNWYKLGKRKNCLRQAILWITIITGWICLCDPKRDLSNKTQIRFVCTDGKITSRSTSNRWINGLADRFVIGHVSSQT
jgi:hypothetical protein